MATQPKSRRSRNRVSGARRKGAGSKSFAKAPRPRKYSLPEGVISAIEAHRTQLHFALSILSSVDASLEHAEYGGTDILDADDPAEALLLKARDIARPLDLLRLAIQRVYQVHSGLDSLNLERAAGGEVSAT